MNISYDNALRRLYSTRAGKMLWKGLISLINSRYVKVLVRKALTEPVSAENISSDYFLLPRIEVTGDQVEKSVLLVVPFYGPDASSLYVDSICEYFKNAGYQIHALIYNDSHWRPMSAYWDKVYYLTVQTGEFGKLKRNETGDLIPDGNKIDDWVGDEVVQFAVSLAHLNKYKFCIVSYVFLSRILDAIPNSVYKVIVTHDIFSGRNTRIYNACGSEQGFYFSVGNEEEKKGLGRADMVLAIQDEDNKYFSDRLGITNVETLPYIPPKNYISRNRPGKIIKIGYIGSGHRPNIDAVLQFISSLSLRDGFEFRLAGVICNHIDKHSLPSFVRFEGFIDDLEEFYAGCDVIINPDTLKSGLKIKCIEALSYGLPLICTEAASLGLSPESKYHQASTIEECAKLVEELIIQPEKIDKVTNLSRQMYERFHEKYYNKIIIEHFEELADKRSIEIEQEKYIDQACLINEVKM